MIKKIFTTHHKKIIVGAPIVFLVIVSGGGMFGSGNYFSFASNNKNFPIVGDMLPVTLAMNADTPINAVGGTVTFDPDMLNVTSLSRVTSSIDLWSEEPSYSNTEGTLHFSGGLVGEKASLPIHGTILTINFTVLKPGKTVITMKNGELLAHDGEGTNVALGSNTLSLYTREMKNASPDVNGDGVLSVSDANALYLKTFFTYDPQYDLNGDGRVSWADVRLLISLL